MLQIYKQSVLYQMMTLTLHAAALPDSGEVQHRAVNLASTHVPFESWIYPPFEGLAAEAYLTTAFFSLHPWTRPDCARLVEEAEKQTTLRPITSDAPGLLNGLKEEFDQRITGIVGTPDGFHLAQTLVDDNGRPFGRGLKNYSGAAFRGTRGYFAFYVHSELQRVPAATIPDSIAQQQIAAADFTPAAAAGPPSAFLRGRQLEASVSFALSNQFTFCRQSLWRGPARSSSTLFSSNAEPIMMLRYDQPRLFVLPGFLKLLGLVRAQALVGHLSGAQYIYASHTTFGTPGKALGDQPFIHGERLSFKPAESFVEVSSRNMTVNREFLQGGTLHDLRFTTDLALHPEWQLHLEEQTEWWRFPLLSVASQRNAEFTLQFSYRPLRRTKQ